MWGKGGGGVIVVDIGLTLGGLIDRRRLGGVGIRLVEGVSPPTNGTGILLQGRGDMFESFLDNHTVPICVIRLI